MRLTGYKLSRKWFDYCFENPEKVTPLHTALYFFAIEHCNRLGWKQKFSLPTEMAKEAIGVKSWHTYIKAFNELIEWKFFVLIERSKNQYSANIIALTYFDEALDEALDEAITKHESKHMTEQEQSIYQSNDSIYKLITNNLKPITDNYSKFEKFVLNLSKEKKRKPEKKEFIPPTIDEVKSYFKENGYNEQTAIKMFNSYSVANWIDSKGNKILSWKQKANMVWFKDENKIKQQPIKLGMKPFEYAK